MGTNYYLHQVEDCPTCGHKEEPLHIGKSSAGWCFSLHIIPEKGINDLSDWQHVWSTYWIPPHVEIRDEYGALITCSKMLEIITERSWNSERQLTGDELRRNYAEQGPNGLLRHKIGHNWVKHGEGTWDCIEGEFS